MTFAVLLSVTLSPISAAAAPTSRDQVRTASPVVALGVGDSVAGYALQTCGKLQLWSLATGRVTPVKANVVDCSSGTASYAHVAIASDEVVWSALEEHNHLYSGIHVVRTSKPMSVRTIYDGEDEDIGALAADGSIVAFSTQGGSYGAGPRATLWVGTTKGVSELAEAVGWMDRIAIEDDLVALGYRNGRVSVFRMSGKRVRAFRKGTAVGGVDLDQGRLVTLTKTCVSVWDLGGMAVLSRRIQGRGSNVELMDAKGGLVLYRSGGKLRMLRLADGRDVAIEAPKTPPDYLHAAFSELGLVVAHLAEPSKQSGASIVRLLRQHELDRLLARGS